jgi:hypothetical protein
VKQLAWIGEVQSAHDGPRYLRRLVRGHVARPDGTFDRRPVKIGCGVRHGIEAGRLPPPPLSPKIVTLSGSPPNEAILRCTQRKTNTRSSSPWLPRKASPNRPPR